MVSDEEGQKLVFVDQDAEVVDEGLAVEEVVRGDQEVPRERPVEPNNFVIFHENIIGFWIELPEPGQVVHPVDRVANVDDLGETFYLNAEGLKCDFVRERATYSMKAFALTVNIRSRGPPRMMRTKPPIMSQVNKPRITQFRHLKDNNELKL